MQDFSYETEPPFAEGAESYDPGDWMGADADGENYGWGDVDCEEPTVVTSDGFGQGGRV